MLCSDQRLSHPGNFADVKVLYKSFAWLKKAFINGKTPKVSANMVLVVVM